MAYRCKENQSKECDGCGSCTPERQPETGVVIEAKIKMKFTAYGIIEKYLRSGDKNAAFNVAEELVAEVIECCGLAGEDMEIDGVEIELNE